jgi:hypothetical protein
MELVFRRLLPVLLNVTGLADPAALTGRVPRICGAAVVVQSSVALVTEHPEPLACYCRHLSFVLAPFPSQLYASQPAAHTHLAVVHATPLSHMFDACLYLNHKTMTKRMQPHILGQRDLEEQNDSQNK